MWEWISSLEGALCQWMGGVTRGWPLRSRTQLEQRICFTFGKGAHHSPVVEPLGAAICLTSGPKACFAHLAQRSWFIPRHRGQIWSCLDFEVVPYLMSQSDHLWGLCSKKSVCNHKTGISFVELRFGCNITIEDNWRDTLIISKTSIGADFAMAAASLKPTCCVSLLSQESFGYC